MIKKQKLSIATTSIRNLTSTELDTVAGGIVTKTPLCVKESLSPGCPVDTGNTGGNGGNTSGKPQCNTTGPNSRFCVPQ